MEFNDLKENVKQFFAPFFEEVPIGVEFEYNCYSREIWRPGGILKEVPSGICIASNHLPFAISHLFLANSCTEILCFCHFYPEYIDNNVAVAFVSLGYLPTKASIKELLVMFPNAKWHLIFENSLPGKVCDCKIALWKNNIDAYFWIIEDQINIQWDSGQVSIPISKFSLSYLEFITKKRFSMRTHKPERRYLNFFNQFVSL